MKINNDFYIYNRREDNAIITNLFSTDKNTQQVCITGSAHYIQANKILTACRKRVLSNSEKNRVIINCLRIMGISEYDINTRLYLDDEIVINDDSTSNTSDNNTNVKMDKDLALRTIDKLIKFFTEFNFTPSYRFINSFAISFKPEEYVRNYFMVQDHPYAKDIAEKVKSAEFKTIIADIKRCGCAPKAINTRFELYYGEPGTGKTTRAIDIANNCIICSSDMLPADLMQNFVFKDGKADFDPSDLWKAMENGTTIVLDEVNMLPFESLRFLQGITDGKDTFNYKGHEIKIHPDFKIYATMNLNVNGQCIPLPAPLVDRSYQIMEFKLTAKDLVSALM